MPLSSHAIVQITSFQLPKLRSCTDSSRSGVPRWLSHNDATWHRRPCPTANLPVTRGENKKYGVSFRFVPHNRRWLPHSSTKYKLVAIHCSLCTIAIIDGRPKHRKRMKTTNYPPTRYQKPVISVKYPSWTEMAWLVLQCANILFFL